MLSAPKTRTPWWPSMRRPPLPSVAPSPSRRSAQWAGPSVRCSPLTPHPRLALQVRQHLPGRRRHLLPPHLPRQRPPRVPALPLRFLPGILPRPLAPQPTPPLSVPLFHHRPPFRPRPGPTPATSPPSAAPAPASRPRPRGAWPPSRPGAWPPCCAPPAPRSSDHPQQPHQHPPHRTAPCRPTRRGWRWQRLPQSTRRPARPTTRCPCRAPQHRASRGHIPHCLARRVVLTHRHQCMPAVPAVAPAHGAATACRPIASVRSAMHRSSRATLTCADSATRFAAPSRATGCRPG